MSTAKAHTPGPWEYLETIGSCEVRGGQGDDWREILSYRYSPDAVNRANAHLISAAPELLEALEAVRQSILDDARPMTNRQHDAIVKADAAIRKARGQ